MELKALGHVSIGKKHFCGTYGLKIYKFSLNCLYTQFLFVYVIAEKTFKRVIIVLIRKNEIVANKNLLLVLDIHFVHNCDICVAILHNFQREIALILHFTFYNFYHRM